jgi:hypothetical protein
MSTLLIAMDRASVRRVDADGRLHLETSNISKANVCPYFGQEIPGWEALGLDPDKTYMLLRDPEELANAAASFNNIPILSEHVPVHAFDDDGHQADLVVGSTGTDAAFDAHYLTNSLVIWSRDAIDGIESDRKRELSSAYRYRPDMTPGEFGGLQYDGVMRDIIGNHVALVIEGRAGPDVVIGDAMMKLKSRTALMVSGALAAHIRPLLAADAKVDISSALKGVTAKSFAMDGAPKKIATSVVKMVKPFLAADEDVDVDDVVKIIEAVQAAPTDEDDIPDRIDPVDQVDRVDGMDDGDDGAKVDALLEYIKGKLSDEDYAAAAKIAQADPAQDESDDDDDKPAMDAKRIRALISAAEKRGAARIADIDKAKQAVKPFVGEVIGMDSAASIYRLALDNAGVDLAGVHESAYAAMVKMLPDPDARPAVAQDRQYGEGKLAKILHPEERS